MISAGSEVWLTHLMFLRTLETPGFYATDGTCDIVMPDRILDLLFRYPSEWIYKANVVNCISCHDIQMTSESCTKYLFSGLLKVQYAYDVDTWLDNKALGYMYILSQGILSELNLRAIVEGQYDRLTEITGSLRELLLAKDIDLPKPLEFPDYVKSQQLYDTLTLILTANFPTTSRPRTEVRKVITYIANVLIDRRLLLEEQVNQRKTIEESLTAELRNDLKIAIENHEIPEFCIAR